MRGSLTFQNLSIKENYLFLEYKDKIRENFKTNELC